MGRWLSVPGLKPKNIAWIYHSDKKLVSAWCPYNYHEFNKFIGFINKQVSPLAWKVDFSKLILQKTAQFNFLSSWLLLCKKYGDNKMFYKSQILFCLYFVVKLFSCAELELFDEEPYVHSFWYNSPINSGEERNGTIFISAPVRLIDIQLGSLSPRSTISNCLSLILWHWSLNQSYSYFKMDLTFDDWFFQVDLPNLIAFCVFLYKTKTRSKSRKGAINSPPGSQTGRWISRRPCGLLLLQRFLGDIRPLSTLWGRCGMSVNNQNNFVFIKKLRRLLYKKLMHNFCDIV